MYQKCPICNGTGTLMNNFGQILKCEVCNGKMIIDEITGLPPQFPEAEVNEDKSNFQGHFSSLGTNIEFSDLSNPSYGGYCPNLGMKPEIKIIQNK
jgi:DnaJ-class molecular chaperone